VAVTTSRCCFVSDHQIITHTKLLLLLLLLLLRTFSSLIGGVLLALMLFTMSCNQPHGQAHHQHIQKCQPP
jgi:hypothetical protein